MKLLLAAFLYLVPQLSLACSPPPFSPEINTPRADSVLVGYVTGNFYPTYERSVLETGRGEEMGGRLYLRIAVTETLKGRRTEIVEAQSGCHNFRPGERVVVLRENGHFRVHDAKYDETEVRVRRVLGERAN
jgi:hypothetical protein